MANVRRSFGKNLEALLRITQSATNEKSNEKIPYEFKTVMAHQIIPGRYQPRKEFDSEALKELADSIREQGVLQPIIVRRAGQEYEIVAGERRWRAAQMADLLYVPVIVHDISDESALAFGLIENIQRKNLNPLEEAQALQRLIDEFSMTHEQVAKAVGRSRVMITNMLRLLNLAAPLKDMLAKRNLEMGHARALITLPLDEQTLMAKQIVDKHLTVRETERAVQLWKLPKDKNKNLNPHKEKVNHWISKLTERISSKISVKINEKGEGRMIIYFSAPHEIDWLVTQLTEMD